MRMFLLIQENFHLELGKLIPGSTISIGGEEKKAKIIHNLVSINLENLYAQYTLQSTQDAAKWNECINPALLGMMHKTFFDEDVRKELGLQKPSTHGKLFQRIAVSGNFLLAIKRIFLGEGPVCTTDDFHNKVSWEMRNISRMNSRTQEWMTEAKDLLKDGYLESSPGMLMGMHNAASTTLGLTAMMYGTDKSIGCYVTLRSSDDSMTTYAVANPTNVGKIIEEENRALKLIGINLSREKTWFFKEKFGEFTSWYQDTVFVSQFGVETSTIRPQGKNPHDDFYSITKTSAVSQNRNEINPIGAQMKLLAEFDCVRRLYKIRLDPNKRVSVSPQVLLAADGGFMPWDCMNCHLEETSLREVWARIDEDREYLLRIRNPDNPFTTDNDQELTYSKEIGCMVLSEIETPRNSFTFMRKANRAVTNLKAKTHESLERAASQIVVANQL
ncbi:hypothetical protein R5R35_010191 [Gryllus longicercus]|uniref:RdRp catalytic domain-containing protein n=1 Tax=Gryllus longicercus TaxID=2509291 RepID=A0AAN9Z9X9_9ORTH